MDTVFETASLSRDYPRLLANVLARGSVVPSRVGETKEVLDLRLVLSQPEYCVTDRDGMSKQFMHEEITQILAGRYDYDRLYAIVPRAAELITAETAYGPRVWPQLQYVAEELEKNPTSRRAVVYVGRDTDLVAAYDPAASTAGEMPCTETWQFHLRENRLHMTVNMRSWDLVWGLGYDVGSFVAVQMAVADHLGVGLGWYVHNAGSAHVYDRHYGIQARPCDDKLDISYLLRGDINATHQAALEAMK